MSFTVAVIGGGIAGSTIALKLAQHGIKSILFEASSSLVNGPPMCHLHAGGALYRQIPTDHCVKMLKESIDTLKCYRYSSNIRPTLLTVPVRDPGSPQDIINRLKFLSQTYQKLIEEDKSNAVLGNPSEYFKVFTEEEVYRLRDRDFPTEPKTMQDWLIPPAKFLQLQKFKFPFIMVQQYGLSSLRTSAHANLVLALSKNCSKMCETRVKRIERGENKWIIHYQRCKKNNHQNPQQTPKTNFTGIQEDKVEVDYIMNACGYQSGIIDDMVGVKQNRMLQFKAAYVTQWKECQGVWPEVIIHGKRKTPQGMGQLTPYKNNIFQIHGMTEDITLFKDGLVKSNDNSSQPVFPNKIKKILENGWQPEVVQSRTEKAIEHISCFIPSFHSSKPTKKPLYGAQQIPGSNPDLRTVEISYQGYNYARSQIVKASTAIKVAEDFITKLMQIFGNRVITGCRQQLSVSKEDVVEKAKKLAIERGYPIGLAEIY